MRMACNNADYAAYLDYTLDIPHALLEDTTSGNGQQGTSVNDILFVCAVCSGGN